MSVKGMLWALGIVGAATLVTVWAADRIPGPQLASAIGVAAPEAAEAPAAASAGGSRWHPAGPVERAAPRDPQPPLAEIGTGRDEDPSGSEDRAAPAGRLVAAPLDPGREDRPEAAASLAVTSLCASGGSRCGSSADCCPGLACNGGMAGYGTAGRCQ